MVSFTYTTKERNKDWIQALSLFLIMTILVIISYSLLLGGSERFTERTFDVFILYSLYGIIGVGAMVIIKFMQPILRKTRFKWIRAYDFYDPEKAAVFWRNFKWTKNPFRVLMIALLLGSFLATFSGLGGIWFTAAPEYQVLHLSDLWYSFEPAGIGELSPIWLIFGLGWGIVWLLSKGRKETFTYIFLQGINIIIGALLFTFSHSLRYPEHGKLIGVFVAAFIWLLITTITGSIIFMWVLKDTSNLFQKIYEKFSIDLALFYTFVIFIILIILTIIVFRVTLKREKKGAVT